MRPETIWFGLLLALLGGMLAAAFAPADLAAIRRWRRAGLLHAAAPVRAARWWAAAAWWRWQRHRDYVNGVDLQRFWTREIRATRPDRRIRTLPRHRLAGGGGR